MNRVIPAEAERRPLDYDSMLAAGLEHKLSVTRRLLLLESKIADEIYAGVARLNISIRIEQPCRTGDLNSETLRIIEIGCSR
ncbi:MAG: hypothetical protein M3Y57_08660 [Acidobacteriota bacterium]|nr:hypothetical protein [Acidobacteriota bacterium]